MNLQEELKKEMKEHSGFLLTANPNIYSKVISEMIKPIKKKKIDKIMSPEMKGMLFGPTIAYKLKLPFISILKPGRIPNKFFVNKSYVDYSKKQKTLQIAKITIKKNDKIWIVDDVFDSGKSGRAIIHLIEKLGGKVAGISIVYNKLNKKDEDYFKKYNFHYLVKMK